MDRISPIVTLPPDLSHSYCRSRVREMKVRWKGGSHEEYQQLDSATMSSCRTIGRVNEHRLSEDIRPTRTRGCDAGSLIAIAGLFLGLLLTPLQANADNAVMEWNQIALAATVTAGQGPVPQLRTMAIVHVSVHDAVNAITCDYRTYLSIRCGPWGTPEAAAIGAAHRALLGLLPAQAAALTRPATRHSPHTD